jgi:hypothetical protein
MNGYYRKKNTSCPVVSHLLTLPRMGAIKHFSRFAGRRNLHPQVDWRTGKNPLAIVG